MVTKKTPKVVLTAVAIVIAAYILSPFYLVLIIGVCETPKAA